MELRRIQINGMLGLDNDEVDTVPIVFAEKKSGVRDTRLVPLLKPSNKSGVKPGSTKDEHFDFRGIHPSVQRLVT